MELAITSTSMKLRDRAPVVFRGEDNWCFEQIRSIGYDGVELHIHDSSQLDRKQLKEELDQFGLSLTSIGTGSAYGKDRVFLSSEDADVRQAAIERIKGHILTASDYPHAVVIIGLIKGKVSDCESRESYFANLIPALRECAEEAGKYQVYLGLEVINRYESDVINTVKEGLEFLEMVGSPWLQLHLDTYHMNIEESDIKKSAEPKATSLYQLSTKIFLMVSLNAAYFLISLLINIFVYYAFLINTEKYYFPEYFHYFLTL